MHFFGPRARPRSHPPCPADPATLLACREPLLVLHAYLHAMGAPALADAVALAAGEPMARLEHGIRAVQVGGVPARRRPAEPAHIHPPATQQPGGLHPRMLECALLLPFHILHAAPPCSQPRLLQLEALLALEALVRVYSQLLRLGGRAAATRSWLAAQLGCSVAAPAGSGLAAGATPRGSSGGGGWGEAPVASDTLQLLLDVLRTRPSSLGRGGGGPSTSGRDGGCGSGSGQTPSVPSAWPRLSALNSGAGDAATTAAALGLSRLSISGAGAGGSVSTGGGGGGCASLSPRQEARLRLWLWRCVNELLRFAEANPTIMPLGGS